MKYSNWRDVLLEKLIGGMWLGWTLQTPSSTEHKGPPSSSKAWWNWMIHKIIRDCTKIIIWCTVYIVYVYTRICIICSFLVVGSLMKIPLSPLETAGIFGMERYEASSGSREFFETTTTFCEKVVAHHFREGSLNYFFFWGWNNANRWWF